MGRLVSEREIRKMRENFLELQQDSQEWIGNYNRQHQATCEVVQWTHQTFDELGSPLLRLRGVPRAVPMQTPVVVQAQAEPAAP
jgi:hypothetical protein